MFDLYTGRPFGKLDLWCEYVCLLNNYMCVDSPFVKDYLLIIVSFD